jgi:RHS repeat-associated protein
MDRAGFVRGVARIAAGIAAITSLAVSAQVVDEVVEPLPPPAYEPLLDPIVEPVTPAVQDTPPAPVDTGWETSSYLGLAGGESMSMMSAPPGVAAGRTPGTFAVTQSGAATYTIPLWTPPGVGEVQLKLALVYSSRGGNGVLGQGWSLQGLSAITRCNRTWAQDGVASRVLNTLDDRYCLDGQQLKLVSGTPGQGGAVYATEIESFSRIVANGPQSGNGPTSFTVTTKNGLVYEYGTTVDSRIFAGTTGTVRTWALSRIRDRASITGGNRIDLTYTNDAQNGSYTNGSYRIATISYPTTATGQGPFYRVSFAYTARPASDIPSGYLAGFVVREPNELSTITIENLVSNSTIKAYYLGYDSGTASSRRRLRTVQECSAASCFPATTISYQSGQAGWPNTPVSLGFSIPLPAELKRLDLNGDGRLDLLYPTAPTSTTRRWWVRYAQGTGYGAAIDTGMTSASSDVIPIGDFDGDGAEDALFPVGGVWYTLRYIGSGLQSWTTWLSVADAPYPTAGDIDGDGRDDLVYISGNPGGAVVARLNTTITYAWPTFSSSLLTIWTAPSGWFYWGNPGQEVGAVVRRMDFNGDGRADFAVLMKRILAQYPPSEIYGTFFVLSTGPSQYATATGVSQPTVVSGSALGWSSLDWNGDGCTDLLTHGSSLEVRLSDCAVGFRPPFVTGASTSAARLMLDWDGDGRTDLLSNVSNTWRVFRSTGESVAASAATGVAAPVNTTWFTTDQNGDALDDLSYIALGSGNAVHQILHLGPAQIPDLATGFVDGFGIARNPAYVTITQSHYTKGLGAVFPLQEFQQPLYVVNQFTASDGTGSTYQNQFHYYNARRNAQGRGFSGFEIQRVFDTRNSLYTYDYVGQAFPFIGMQKQRLVYQSNGTTLLHSTTLSHNQQVAGGSGVEQRVFPFVSWATDSRYELGGASNGQLISQTSRSFAYADGFGNLTQEIVWAYDRDVTSPFYNSFWTTTVNRTFANSTTHHCLGLPATASVQQSAPGQTSQTRSYSFQSDPQYCRVMQQVIEPSIAAQKVTTALGFDLCGNANSVSVTGASASGSAMATRVTGVNYGSRCQLPETVTNALGQPTSVAYNYSFGVPSQLTDPNTLITSWQHDDFGRPIRESRPDGTRTDWTYAACSTPPCWGVGDLRFLVTEYPIDTAGQSFNERRQYYDGLDRLRYDESYRVLGILTREVFAYDSLGRVVTQHQPYSTTGNGYRTWNYDALGRLTFERLYQPGGVLDRTTSYVYAGRTTSVTDPLSRVHQRVHDVAGRLRRSIDPSPGGTTQLDYDVFGHLNRIQDPGGAVSTGSFNLRGFRTQWNDADRGSWSFSGNSLNELVAWTDAKNQSFSASYDSLGRLTSRTTPEGTSSFVFGTNAAARNIGSLVSKSGFGYSEQRLYDSIGRLATRTITTDQAYQFDYSYNVIGAVDTVTYPVSPVPSGQSGNRFKAQTLYSYGAPYQIRDTTGATPKTLWTLNAANDYGSATSETLGTSPTTTSVTIGFKPWTNELTSYQAGVGSGVQTNRQNLAYQWDTVGNLTQRQDLGQGLTEIFSHDGLNRLTSSTLNGSLNFSATYDAAGNLRSKLGVGSYSYYDSARPNRLSLAGTIGFSHDANGNVITRGGLTQTWASFNLPTSLQATVNGSTLQSQLWYGPDFQRWKQVASYVNGTETFHYVGGLLEKKHATSTGKTYWQHYVHAPSGQTIVVSRNSDATTSTTFALSDHLGSGDALLDLDGSLKARLSFTAFGERRGSSWTGTPTTPDWAAIADSTRHGFTWHEHLDGINLIHMNGRVYDPLVGRFLSVDPIIGNIADSQQVNPYAYVGNRPLSYTDPTGWTAADGGGGAPGFYPGPNDGSPGSWRWWDRQFDKIGDFFSDLFGGSKPPPPPATALPGISAQNGMMICGPGGSSAACSGMILYTTAPVMVEPVPGFPAVTGGLIRGPLGLPIIIWYPGSPEYEAASILVGHTGEVLKEMGCRLKVPICGVPGRPAIDPARSSTVTVVVMTAYVLDRWLDGPWMSSQAGDTSGASAATKNNQGTRSGDLPARGKPNSSAAVDRGDGKGTIRDYGPDGRARTDYDFGHDHPTRANPRGAGDPHAHDWDWSKPSRERQPPRPLKSGE